MESFDIQEIYSNSDRLVNHVDSSWRRYIYCQIDWKNDLIAIKGARGVGKTTLLLPNHKTVRQSPEKHSL